MNVADTHLQKLGSHGGFSHRKGCRLEAGSSVCLLQTLNRDGGYIQLNQGGRVYGIQLNKETGLANRRRSRLCSLQAVNIQEDQATVDLFSTLSTSELRQAGVVFPFLWI